MKTCINCEASFAPVSESMNLDRDAIGFILNDHLCVACQTGAATLRLVITRDFLGKWQLESSQPLRPYVHGVVGATLDSPAMK